MTTRYPLVLNGTTIQETQAGDGIQLPTALAIAYGGTGQTTANAAFNALAPSQTGNTGKYLTTDGSNTSWALNPLGTVTSVDVLGGTTGLTTSGGPITTSGSITIAGTLNVANGGSGATTLTGILKGNGTSAFSAATAGTDYIAPSGALGTPSSGTLTNCSGLPISTGVSGLGSNVATFLATPSSANLATAVTDETGSGSLVFGTSPTLTNPTITNYTETSYTANSSTGITLALTNGTVQIITLTANTTITMPTAGAGKSFIMYLRQDGTGSRTVTWSTVNWAGGTAPTVTSTASKQDIYSFFSDGTSWYGVTVGQNYTQ
jgi:hypothetical protein